MSKFFRSGDSSTSSSDNSDDEPEEILSNSLAQLDPPGQNIDRGADTLAVDRPRNPSASEGKDWLLHALLEERCLKEVIEEHRVAGRSSSDQQLRREGHDRYKRLCAQLAPLNLVSAGLDSKQHSATRQRVRDGLDRMTAINPAAPSANRQSALPPPLRRLLTDATASTASLPHINYNSTTSGTTSLLDGAVPGLPSLMPSRYVQDFDEIGILGRGGFGEVYQVRHKIDNCDYAVKKIPIRSSLMARIATGGQAVLDEVLAEVRSLSRLQHPNIVRYFSSWIEWSTRSGSADSSADLIGPTLTSQSSDARLGADISSSMDSLRRVRTESDTNDDIGFTFENSNSAHAPANVVDTQSRKSESFDISRSDAKFPDGAFLSRLEPVLALHMQMSIHPLNLADFLSPPETEGTIQPLAHCFHLDPSIGILLALLDGVEYLHSEGVVHRDLKPANIFLRHESNARSMHGCIDLSTCTRCQQAGIANPAKLSICIGDFGLVTQLASSDGTSAVPKGAVGTEIYRPTTSKADPSPSLDIFALGIIACELLHKFGTQMERRETLHALRRGTFPEQFASFAGQHAGEIKDCVSRMLALDGNSEPATIGDLRRRLTRLPDILSIQKGNGHSLRRITA